MSDSINNTEEDLTTLETGIEKLKQDIVTKQKIKLKIQ